MNWKEFLFGWKNILLFLGLFAVASIIPNIGLGKLGAYYYGQPFPYFTFWEKVEGVGHFCDLPPCPPEGLHLFSYYNLFFNLIFWFIITILIVWIYNRVKKK